MISDLFGALTAFVSALGSGVPVAAISAALIVGLVLVVARSNRRLSKKYGSATHRDAKAFLAEGLYLDAGRSFQALGDYDQAIAAYSRAGAHREMGQLFESLKHWDSAAQAYETAGEHERAATMLLRLGEERRAAELLKRAGKPFAAAELFEKIGKFSVAASLFQSAGHVKRAAVMYERAEQWRRAAELFEEEYVEEFRRWKERGSPANGQASVAASAQQTGRLWIKAGEVQRAAAIFRQQGLMAEAAEALGQSGNDRQAAELYLAQGEYEKAAVLFERLGDQMRCNEALAEIRVRSGAFVEAADLFLAVNQPRRAAELFERAGEPQRAAELHLAAGDTRKAADLYLEAGCREEAAEALAKGRRFREAAELYVQLEKGDLAAKMFEEMGDGLEASKLYQQLGRIDDAIEALQGLDSESPFYYEGSLRLGRLFLERGILSAAKERYQKLLAFCKDDIERELEVVYRLGQVCEAESDYDNALRLYEKVLARDFGFRDVRERVESVKKARLAKESPAPPPPTPTPPAQPKTEARYKIIKQIGQGGMGVVYRAEDTVLHRIVAYKVLPASVKEQKSFLENFLQEARIAASINHPNIVTIYDTGHDPNGEVFISMELVDGFSLKELLDKMGPLPLPQFISIAKQICSALAYAHGRRIIHRDIKPSNIMLRRDRMVKIMDFGLAKMVNDAIADRTSVKGTPLYMAPEQILGKEVDHQSDLYALGCTLYRMATGRLPFTKGDLYYQHLHVPPQSPKDVNPKLPSEINGIILRCLEKEKSKRYQQASVILGQLEQIKLAA